MQLIDIATTSIALFGTVYFIAALAAHLHFCWSNPHTIELKRFDRKLAAPVEAPEGGEAPAPVAVEPMPLLLPPATEVHPFELSLEWMPALEPIAAVHQPATPVEPPTEEALNYSSLSSAELRKVCSDRGIRWRGVNGGKHLLKPEMLAALTA